MSEHDDDDGLSWLSEDERAALADLDDEGPGADDDLGDADAGDDDDDEADAARAGDEARAKGEEAGESGPAGPDRGAVTEEGETQAPFQPVYRVNLPADFQQRMETLATASQALAKQYEDGEFDLAEFQNRQRQLSEYEWTLRAAALKAEMAREQQQQTMSQRWLWEQEAYFRLPEHRAFRDDPVIAHAFEGALKLLAADQANENRDMPWFLEEAGRMTRDKLRELAQGLGLAGPGGAGAGNGSGNGRGAGARGAGAWAGAGVGNAGGAGRNGSGRGGAKASPPPSLARMPAAAMPDPGGDEFAYLDKLGGLEAERALSRLSAEQLDRYLAAT